MNSDSSELDTSSNSRGIFLPPSIPLRLSGSTTITNSTSSTTTAYQNQHHEKLDDFNNEFNSITTMMKPQERYVWEMRTRSPNITPASTVLNSPDLNNDTQYSLHHHQRHQHHQIRVGRSPGSQFGENNILPQGLVSPGSPTDIDKVNNTQCLRDGEIVVFDDIDTNWMNKSASTASSRNTYAPLHHTNNEDILKVTKMIGQLPIAEYEGSPRRFGNQPQAANKNAAVLNSTSHAYPKRPPGFPQRVSPKAAAQQQQDEFIVRQQQQYYQYQQQQHHKQSKQQEEQFINVAPSSGNINKSIGNLIDIDGDSIGAGGENDLIDGNGCGGDGGMKNKSPTFDYLYEFSETRKVLEEFFKNNPDDEKRFTDFTESADDIASCDTQQHYDHLHDDEKQHQLQQQQRYIEQSYIGQRLARIPKEELSMIHRSPKKQHCDNPIYIEHNDIELYIDSNSRSSGELADTELEANIRHHSRNFTLSPETTDYDSNCGDLDSLSNDINCPTDYGKLYTSMPVLEDGLSSGHASDTENNCAIQQTTAATSLAVSPSSGCDDIKQNKAENNERQQEQQQQQHKNEQNLSNNKNVYNYTDIVDDITEVRMCMDGIMERNLLNDFVDTMNDELKRHSRESVRGNSCGRGDGSGGCGGGVGSAGSSGCCTNNNISPIIQFEHEYDAITVMNSSKQQQQQQQQQQLSPSTSSITAGVHNTLESPLSPLASNNSHSMHSLQQRQSHSKNERETSDIQEAMKEIRSALQRAKVQPEKLKFCDEVLPPDPDSPIWVPRTEANNISQLHHYHHQHHHNQQQLQHPRDDEEADTDLETDRLLGQQRLDEQCYGFDEKTIWPKTSRITSNGDDSNDNSPTTSDVGLLSSNTSNSITKPQAFASATIRQGIGTSVTSNSPEHCQIVGNADVALTSPEKLQCSKSPTGSIRSLKDSTQNDRKIKQRNKEALLDPAVLIEGVLFRARYLGSTQLVCEGQPTKSTRMMQAEEAVSRIKAPEGESQPSTDVDLFISTEKIMVLNTDLKEIMMDHALRTISYIADIGDLVVLMARRRFVSSDSNSSADNDAEQQHNRSNGGEQTDVTTLKEANKENAGGTSNNITAATTTTTMASTTTTSGKPNRTPKMICHVFESDEAQFIAQSIGQAFQVAYMEFLKANGIEDHSFVKEMDYQEVLNSQEIFGDELEIFAKKELQKEVVVPKAKGEILGVVIVESGWGSMLPTVVIANLMSSGAAARCGQLNIGDQLIAINGMSLVGLPLSTCQSYIRNAKNQTAVKFTVVPCPPVVEVKIKRPNTKYQLGFSVQNGVICSLLRGGIAERGGVRVGHRIIEINNQSVVAVPHEKIVNLLATSVGEILMKTMPTSMFRLLTGQENPIFI